jgi:chorismate mutase
MSTQSSPPAPPPAPDPNAAPDLAALRAEIDRIDDAMHDLVMRRAEVVGRLTQSRAKGAGPALRPGREALILRRLLGRHSGGLPRSGLVRIWRAVINAHTSMQGPFAVAVFNTAPGSGYVALAREHFGATTPARALNSPAQVLGAVSNADVAVGVLPLPGEDADTTWWTALLPRDAPRLWAVARLPFWAPRVEGAPRAQALVVGAIPPEPTGADRSLIAFEVEGEVSRTRISAALTGVGLPPSAMLVCRRQGLPSAVLVEVDGFVAETDPRLAGLAQAGAEKPVLAGAYAIPLDEA